MNIEYINDTGSRHEWRCKHCDSDYVVTFHYLDEAWSVQRVRGDGQREILDRREAEELLGLFPRKKAMSLTQAEAQSDTGVKPMTDRGSLGLDASTRSKSEASADPDSPAPSA